MEGSIQVCSGIRLPSEFSGQLYMAFFLSLRLMGGSGANGFKTFRTAAKQITTFYTRADYHVNNFLKFLAGTQNRASVVKLSSRLTGPI